MPLLFGAGFHLLEDHRRTIMKNEQNIAVRIYGNICVKMPLQAWLGVKYLAYDENGDLYGYDKIPMRKMTYWDVASRGDKSVLIVNLNTLPRDWTASCLSVEQILESPANAELAAWEKENNIAHPVPEETLEVLLDILMKAPNQAAEPTASEDTAPDEDTARIVDPVNHPTHYRSNGIECIDAIRAGLTPEQFEGYCRGNAMKYLWRAGKKVKPGQTVEEAREEDLAKARWYLDTVIKKWKTDREFAKLADWAISAAKEILAQAKQKKDGADYD
jgi:hypothetical protein